MENRIKFILIDDNQIDNKVNSSLLGMLNQTSDCLEFSSCCKGLDFIKANTAQLIDFKTVILLDLQMPEVSGFECLGLYLDLPTKFRKKCEVYILSSTIDENDVKRAKKNTLVNGILEKPLDIFLLKKHLGIS